MAALEAPDADLEAATDGELAPLVTIDHSSAYCETRTVCAKGIIRSYRYHYNSGGRHYHYWYVYANNSYPWYYCDKKSYLGTHTEWCGSP